MDRINRKKEKGEDERRKRREKRGIKRKNKCDAVKEKHRLSLRLNKILVLKEVFVMLKMNHRCILKRQIEVLL